MRKRQTEETIWVNPKRLHFYHIWMKLSFIAADRLMLEEAELIGEVNMLDEQHHFFGLTEKEHWLIARCFQRC